MEVFIICSHFLFSAAEESGCQSRSSCVKFIYFIFFGTGPVDGLELEEPGV